MSFSSSAFLRLFPTLIVIATAAFSANPARTADVKLCEAYVAEAIKYAKIVRARNCGYDLTHPQWSLEPSDHLRWCRKANNDSVDKERHNRRTSGYKCDMCRTYADQAIKSVTTAVKNTCTGLDGPRWSQDEQVHFGWCMGLKEITTFWGESLGYPSIKPLQQEEKEREAHVGQCLVNKANQPLVAQPAGPEPTGKVSEGIESTARQAPGPRSASTVDTAQTELQTKKRKRVTSKKPKTVHTGLQTATPCKLPDGRPCHTPTRAVAPGLLEGGGGFGAQGPAATGALIQTGAPQLQRGSGGGGSGLR
jgi:hypothetical protein